MGNDRTQGLLAEIDADFAIDDVFVRAINEHIHVATYGVPWPQSYDANGMYVSPAIENPSTAEAADQGIERAGKLVEALDDATAALVYHLLHARGCRVSGGSYVEAFRRAKEKK